MSLGHTPHLHFWTLRDVQEIMDWDPDDEPGRFTSGFSHGFAELFVRLRALGARVSIGSEVPRSATVVVTSLEELTEWHDRCLPRILRQLARAMLGTSAGLAVIRVDLPLQVRSPAFATLEMMPNPALVSDPSRQRYLPMLPQRGILARDGHRGARIEVAALKAFPQNVPEWIDEEFVRACANAGVEVRLDIGFDAANRWEDFSGVDVALCTQASSATKPPTKVVNAWAACCIPLCVATDSYEHLVTHDVDALIARDAAEAASVLRALGDDPDRAERLLQASRAAGQRFRASDLARQWEEALLTAPRSPRLRMLTTLMVEYARVAVRRVLPQRLGDRLLPKLAY